MSIEDEKAYTYVIGTAERFLDGTPWPVMLGSTNDLAASERMLRRHHTDYRLETLACFPNRGETSIRALKRRFTRSWVMEGRWYESADIHRWLAEPEQLEACLWPRHLTAVVPDTVPGEWQ